MDFKKVDLNDLAKEIHSVNVEKGFWEKPNDVTTQRMLITSELYEAFEAHRKGNNCTYGLHRFENWLGLEQSPKLPIEDEKELFERYVKDTIEDEVADTAIRLLDFGFWAGVKINSKDFKSSVYYNFKNDFINDLDWLITYIRGQLTNIAIFEWGVISSFVMTVKFAEHYNIDLMTHIRLKLEYNKTRGYKHGKNY